uniref:Uncharacterized protein n=1 Tax=Ditylenchus dipsaci TaxID=166011 RepID=A0A915E7G4_9BILA
MHSTESGASPSRLLRVQKPETHCFTWTKIGVHKRRMEAKGSLIPAQNVAEFETPEKLLGRLRCHRRLPFKELTEKCAGKEVEMERIIFVQGLRSD